MLQREHFQQAASPPSADAFSDKNNSSEPQPWRAHAPCGEPSTAKAAGAQWVTLRGNDAACTSPESPRKSSSLSVANSGVEATSDGLARIHRLQHQVVLPGAKLDSASQAILPRAEAADVVIPFQVDEAQLNQSADELRLGCGLPGSVLRRGAFFYWGQVVAVDAIHAPLTGLPIDLAA